MDQERLTDAEIAELERLEKAATPGPWCEDPEGAPPWFIMAGDPSIDVPCVGEINTTADMEFIINARRLVPRLLAELRERRAADGVVVDIPLQRTTTTLTVQQ